MLMEHHRCRLYGVRHRSNLAGEHCPRNRYGSRQARYGNYYGTACPTVLVIDDLEVAVCHVLDVETRRNKFWYIPHFPTLFPLVAPHSSKANVGRNRIQNATYCVQIWCLTVAFATFHRTAINNSAVHTEATNKNTTNPYAAPIITSRMAGLGGLR